MAKGDIILSPKYGVNATVTKCYFCQADGGLAMFGRLRRHKAVEMWGEDFVKTNMRTGEDSDMEAPRNLTLSPVHPCQKCEDFMEKGVILISVRDGESGVNPFRTGGWVVMTKESVREALGPPTLVEAILKVGWCFIPDEIWKRLGLPMGDEGAESDE